MHVYVRENGGRRRKRDISKREGGRERWRGKKEG